MRDGFFQDAISVYRPGGGGIAQVEKKGEARLAPTVGRGEVRLIWTARKNSGIESKR